MDPLAMPAEWWRPASPLAGAPPDQGMAAPATQRAGSALPFRGLMAFLFIGVLAPQNMFPALAPLRIALLAAVVSIGAYVTDVVTHGPPAGRSTPAMWVAFGLLVWAVVTLPMSYWPGGSLAFLQDEYVKTLAVFWLLSRVLNTRQKLLRATSVLALLGVPLALTAVSNFLSGAYLADGQREVKRIAGYESGLAQNPNDLALMLNLILPFAVATVLRTRGWRRVFLLGICLLYVTGVIATFSRAGFLTLAGIYLYYMVKLMRHRRWGAALAAVVLVLAVVPLLPGGYVSRLGTIVDIEADPTGSAQTRANDTQAALQIVLGSPLVGAGVGMNILALNEARGRTWVEVHNAYLECAVDLGLPGLMLFLLLLGLSLRDARRVQKRLYRRQDLDGLYLIAQAAEASLVAFALAALFHPIAYHFYFYLAAGIAISVRTVYELEHSSLVPAPPERHRGPAVTAAWPGAVVEERSC